MSNQDQKQFFIPEMEGALCLWEAFIERERQHPAKEGEDLRELHGSYALRRAVLDITHDVEQLWLSMGEDYQNDTVFDFEFCPDVIEYCVIWEAMNYGDGLTSLRPNSKELLLARHALEKQFNPNGAAHAANASF